MNLFSLYVFIEIARVGGVFAICTHDSSTKQQP